ncbi:Hypothetical predicted protein [Olea europaea subsp. europaea]|uniref:Uncharacterized protein n=1 Tax=Olea europaea subsp. europaea TaxID=158383 RepID=A0A8S0QE31_OLEEU|nr:Hypothetical predicted protein [Olea europaea subsp. europaea]
MDGDIEILINKLSIRRLDAIEENDTEHCQRYRYRTQCQKHYRTPDRLLPFPIFNIIAREESLAVILCERRDKEKIIDLGAPRCCSLQGTNRLAGATTVVERGENREKIIERKIETGSL